MIFMTHPQHGAHNVVSEAEAKALETLGWKVSTHAEWLGDKLKKEVHPVKEEQPAEPIEQTIAPPDELTALRRAWSEKFGEMPHHRKSAETLRRELED